jgi:glutamate-1-semialdehyde 2,1-aminomutase
MMTVSLESATATFMEKFKASGELCAIGDRFIPGGFSRNSLKFGPHPIYADRGDGAYIQTIEGHRLLDFHNNFSCNILGHNHPAIHKAIADINDRGYSFGNPMNHEHKLAEIICDRIASVEKVVFCCSASEACIAAARYARSYTGKNKIAKFEGGYHGLGDDFMVSLHPSPELFPGAPEFPKGVPCSGGLSRWAIENTTILPQNNLVSCERILTQNAGDIACLFMELQAGAGGVITLEKEFVKNIRALTEKLGILLIVDETVTLRSDYHGMQGLYDIIPDLTVMGKMIGGGLPLGAVGGLEKYMEMNTTEQVYHSGTHHGHPLATAAGIACMEVMNEATYKRLNGYGSRIKEEMNQWAKMKNYPLYFFGIGSHLGYEITDKLGREYKTCREMFTYSNEQAMQTSVIEMANRDIYPMYRGQITLSEPMTDADIDTFMETTKSILDDILCS